MELEPLSLSYSAPQVKRAFALCMNAIVSMVLMKPCSTVRV